MWPGNDLPCGLGHRVDGELSTLRAFQNTHPSWVGLDSPRGFDPWDLVETGLPKQALNEIMTSH